MPLPVPPQKPSNKNFNWGRLSKTLSFWILIILIPVENSAPEIERLRQKGVDIDAQDARPSVVGVLVNFLPWLVLVGFWIFLFKQMQAGGGKGFSFGESRAQLLPRGTPKGTLARG